MCSTQHNQASKGNHNHFLEILFPDISLTNYSVPVFFDFSLCGQTEKIFFLLK